MRLYLAYAMFSYLFGSIACLHLEFKNVHLRYVGKVFAHFRLHNLLICGGENVSLPFACEVFACFRGRDKLRKKPRMSKTNLGEAIKH